MPTFNIPSGARGFDGTAGARGAFAIEAYTVISPAPAQGDEPGAPVSGSGVFDGNTLALTTAPTRNAADPTVTGFTDNIPGDGTFGPYTTSNIVVGSIGGVQIVDNTGTAGAILPTGDYVVTTLADGRVTIQFTPGSGITVAADEFVRTTYDYATTWLTEVPAGIPDTDEFFITRAFFDPANNTIGEWSVPYSASAEQGPTGPAGPIARPVLAQRFFTFDADGIGPNSNLANQFALPFVANQMYQFDLGTAAAINTENGGNTGFTNLTADQTINDNNLAEGFEVLVTGNVVNTTTGNPVTTYQFVGTLGAPTELTPTPTSPATARYPITLTQVILSDEAGTATDTLTQWVVSLTGSRGQAGRDANTGTVTFTGGAIAGVTSINGVTYEDRVEEALRIDSFGTIFPNRDSNFQYVDAAGVAYQADTTTYVEYNGTAYYVTYQNVTTGAPAEQGWFQRFYEMTGFVGGTTQPFHTVRITNNNT